MQALKRETCHPNTACGGPEQPLCRVTDGQNTLPTRLRRGGDPLQTVMSPFGIIQYPEGLLILPMAFVGGLGFGEVKAHMQWSLLYLLVFSGVFFPLAVHRMRRRLIQ